MISKLCSLCLTFCSLSAIFWSLSMSISLLGYALSFFGQFSHSTIVVALSLTFLNLLKSCDFVLFSWRKMQKTKKNAALFKILYIISPQGEHFKTWFKQILKATVQGYMIFPLSYACFSSRKANVSIFGNAHWTLKTAPSQHHHQSIPDFFWFFLYFIAISHPAKHFFLYLEVCTGPWNSTHPSPVMTTIPIFFVMFSLFYWYFSCSIAALSIFGNVHWTLNTMPNMVTNHPPFFSIFFLIFFAILLLFLLEHSHTFHIWKCALDPENHAQYGHQPSPILSLIFFLFCGYFIAIFHSA